MKIIHREDIHIITRNSDLSEKGIERAFKENVYNDKASWQVFLRLFFITLGIGFAVSGIIFFFAYNWAYLHKFVKIGLIEGLIIITTCLVFLPKINNTIRNIILTGAAVLVGVLFAVYGQIYQTGANAYDFFLAWTVFVALWVIVSNFAPLWLFFLLLMNTTIFLYSEQVANDWSDVSVYTLLFIINTTVLITAIILSKFKRIVEIPNWFITIVALACATYGTIGMIIGIFDQFQLVFLILLLLVSGVFAMGIWYGFKARSGFYLSVISFCTILILSAMLIEMNMGESMFLFVGLFIVASITLVIKILIDIQKQWANEK